MNVNSKGLILSAIIVAMGLTAMGVAIRNGIVTFKDRDRCVVVKGLAEREVEWRLCLEIYPPRRAKRCGFCG